MSKQVRSERELERVCAYCENASPLYDRDFMLCQKKGVVGSGHVCRRFSYDPLKRVPVPRRRVDEDIELPTLPE